MGKGSWGRARQEITTKGADNRTQAAGLEDRFQDARIAWREQLDRRQGDTLDTVPHGGVKAPLGPCLAVPTPWASHMDYPQRVYSDVHPQAKQHYPRARVGGEAFHGCKPPPWRRGLGQSDKQPQRGAGQNGPPSPNPLSKTLAAKLLKIWNAEDYRHHNLWQDSQMGSAGPEEALRYFRAQSFSD